MDKTSREEGRLTSLRGDDGSSDDGQAAALRLGGIRRRLKGIDVSGELLGPLLDAGRVNLSQCGVLVAFSRH